MGDHTSLSRENIDTLFLRSEKLPALMMITQPWVCPESANMAKNSRIAAKTKKGFQ
jgi:hypothetical protein